MKICASCGASLPDGAAFCITCGSKEFTSAYMPDLNAPEPEKPKIEYDQYGRPIGQNYQQPEYEQPHFSENYNNSYNERYSDQIDHPQYLEGYGQPQNTQQYGQTQYIEGYQPQYEQPQYGQQSYQQSQYAPQYEQSGYEQPQYEQQAYEQEYEQPQYEQPAYEQEYEQPQYEQPVYEQEYEQPQYEQPQAEQPKQEEKTESDFDPYAAKKDAYDPHEAAKNFKFEKKSQPAEQEEPVQEDPKNLKEYIAFFRNTDDHTLEYDPYSFSSNKKYCKLAVLGFTFWVPLVFAKDCASARFYANQGLLIFIVELILLIPELIFTGIVGIGFSYGVLAIIGIVIDLILTAIIYCVPIFMIVTAFQNIDAGKVKNVPFIGKFRILK